MTVAFFTGVLYLVAIVGYVLYIENKIHKDKPKFKN